MARDCSIGAAARPAEVGVGGGPKRRTGVGIAVPPTLADQERVNVPCTLKLANHAVIGGSKQAASSSCQIR